MQNINTTSDAIFSNEEQVLSQSDSDSSSSVASLTKFEAINSPEILSQKIFSDGDPLFGPNKIEPTETLYFSNQSSSNSIFEQSSTEYETSGDLPDDDWSIKIFFQPAEPKVVQSKPYDFQKINKVASEILELTRTARISNSTDTFLIVDEINFFDQLHNLQSNEILNNFTGAICDGIIDLNGKEDRLNFFYTIKYYNFLMNKRQCLRDNEDYFDYSNIKVLRANHLKLLNATTDFFEIILQIAQNYINEEKELKPRNYELSEDRESVKNIGHVVDIDLEVKDVCEEPESPENSGHNIVHVGHDTKADVFEDEVSPKNFGHQNPDIDETLGNTDESQPIIIYSAPARAIFLPEFHASCENQGTNRSLSPFSRELNDAIWRRQKSKRRDGIITPDQTYRPLDIAHNNTGPKTTYVDGRRMLSVNRRKQLGGMDYDNTLSLSPSYFFSSLIEASNEGMKEAVRDLLSPRKISYHRDPIDSNSHDVFLDASKIDPQFLAEIVVQENQAEQIFSGSPGLYQSDMDNQEEDEKIQNVGIEDPNTKTVNRPSKDLPNPFIPKSILREPTLIPRRNVSEKIGRRVSFFVQNPNPIKEGLCRDGSDGPELFFEQPYLGPLGDVIVFEEIEPPFGLAPKNDPNKRDFGPIINPVITNEEGQNLEISPRISRANHESESGLGLVTFLPDVIGKGVSEVAANPLKLTQNFLGSER